MTVRTLTILFTDIVGSTALFTGLSDREAERRRLAHFTALREQLARHGGRELKSLGDGLMAVFDSSLAAIEAAIAMQRGTVGHGRGGPEAISIRIGISSGDVTEVRGDCFGAAVVEASRLCARARGGQVLLAESTRLLASGYGPLCEIGELELKGLPEPTRAWEAEWSPEAPAHIRAVLADDAVLVREGIAHVLEHSGIEVVAQAGNAEELLRLTAELRPDVAITDVRMPPTHTIEGLEAAETIRVAHPGTGVLLLSQEVQPHYATRLLAASPTGVGYMLKERVGDIREFAEAARAVAAGGTAFEPGLLPMAETTTR